MKLKKVHVYKGQRWRKKNGANEVVITSCGSEEVKAKNRYSSRMAHHISKKDLARYWEPVEELSTV